MSVHVCSGCGRVRATAWCGSCAAPIRPAPDCPGCGRSTAGVGGLCRLCRVKAENEAAAERAATQAAGTPSWLDPRAEGPASTDEQEIS